MKRIFMLGTVMVFLLCAACWAQPKAVALEYKYKPGDIDKYRIAMNMDIKMPNVPAEAMPPISFKMSGIVKQKVLSVLPDGSAKLSISYGDFKMSGPGMPQQAAQIPNMTFTLRITKDGRVLDMEGFEQILGGSGISGMNLGMMTGQIGQFGVFPEWPVKVGDAWKQTIPVPFGGGNMEILSSLHAAAIPLGKETASKIKQTFRSHIDLADMMKGMAASSNTQVPAEAQQFMSSMSGGMDLAGWGVLYFSPKRGKVLKGNADMKAVVNLTMPAAAVQEGAPARVTMVMNMVMSVSKMN